MDPRTDLGAVAGPGRGADDERKAGRPEFLLVQETAELMRMDPSTLYRHLRADRFPAVKVGGRYLVPLEAVRQIVQEALATGRCVVVEQWAARWREERAAEALARGLTRVPSASGVAS